ncbi:MFS transporter [Micromonospora sp. DT229]|uniref:MFS transporter n=1 Tax=Micromonospora sp. DT229 TaxID=3393430 RepID=UPI003CEB0619
MKLLEHLVPPQGPVRVLAVSNLARTFGNGILLSVSVLYFIRSVGISPTRVGLGLSLAAAFGMLISIPAGHVADRLGARNTAMAFVALQGALVCGYTFVGGFTSFVVLAALVVGAEAGADASRGALVAQAVPREQRVKARAYLRSVTNIGISLGTVVGGVALQLNTGTAYRTMLLVSGAAFILGALLFLRLRNEHVTRHEEKASVGLVLKDRPYLAVTALTAVLAMNDGLLTVALPLWIADRTDAPVAVFSAILLVNTIMVILFQVRASAGAETVQGGARALRRSGMLLAVCCGFFALAAGAPAWLAVVVLIVGALIHVLGELLYAAGSWALSYELAPEHAQGQYQGLFGMGGKVAKMVTPAITAVLIIGVGRPGWLIFGALLFTAGAITPFVARWAERTRPPAHDVAAVAPATTVDSGMGPVPGTPPRQEETAR